MASLSVTPIRRLTGWNEIIKLRRMLGLFAFFYGVAAHADVDRLRPLLRRRLHG